ncbi:MAG: MerC domain-containing protein [Bacteroidetes bacterium]|nr:MerC domain-containing protein [Bacteroidota bacterium]
MKSIQYDRLGILSSVLCLIHCLVVPIGMLFALELEWLHHWIGWTYVQIGFISIGAWAVYHAAKHIDKKWISVCLWAGIGILVLALFAEHHLQELMNYSAAALLIAAHTVNLFIHSQHHKLVKAH